MTIVFVDGMGGGLAAQVIASLPNYVKENHSVLALGTNALATAKMIKSGLSKGATGESAICFSVGNADIIIGPIGIIIPNSMLGELTPQIATTIASCKAKKILIPLIQGHVEIVGLENKPMSHLVKETIAKLEEYIGGK